MRRETTGFTDGRACRPTDGVRAFWVSTVPSRLGEPRGRTDQRRSGEGPSGPGTERQVQPVMPMRRRRNEGRGNVDRAQKAELVSTMHQVFKDTGVIVVAHNTGLVAAQSADFRRKMKEAGGQAKVVKNNLAKLALKDTAFEGLSDLLKGPCIMAYSKDPVVAAKITTAFAKANDKLVVLGGGLGRSVLDANGVKALADLPSLDDLRAKLIGLLNAPATKIARTVAEPGAKLARVVQAKASAAPVDQAA
jgi:large subunit ribosomal protein L10